MWSMILEAAYLQVRNGSERDFEIAFNKASSIISSSPGYITHELHKCIESESKYLLLVKWKRLEDHTVGFRNSAKYQRWKKLLHHFYEPFLTVEHFEMVPLPSRD